MRKFIARTTAALALFAALAFPALADEILGPNTTGTVIGVAVTPGATANTEGTWTNIGTTTAAAEAISLRWFNDSAGATNADYLCDIGTGATPTIVANNILATSTVPGAGEFGGTITLPISVADSTDVDVRCMSSATSGDDLLISVHMHANNPFGTTSVSSIDTYGADESDSGGTPIVECSGGCGGADDEGDWQEIVSSSGADIKALWIGLGAGGDWSIGDPSEHLIDIGTGAAASEVVLIENIPANRANGPELISPAFIGPFAVDISSGTRIVVRIEGNETGEHDPDIILYGTSTFLTSGGSFQSIGTDDTGTTSTGTSITPSATPNTDGSWVSLGTTTAEMDALSIFMRAVDSEVGCLVDIGTGGTPSAVVSNLPVQAKSTSGGIGWPTFVVTLPITVADSTLISARSQCNTTSGSGPDVSIVGHTVNPMDADPVASVESYGANASDSGGTNYDAGATADTKGGYTEITSSTSADMALVWMFQGNNTDYSRSEDDWLTDLATGAAASETPFLTNIPETVGSGLDTYAITYHGPYRVNISSGTRLSVNAQTSTNNSTNRISDYVLFGADVDFGGAPPAADPIPAIRLNIGDL